MDTLPFKVIKTETQYNDYCAQLEALVVLKKKSTMQQDSIELLTLLIEKWDESHNTFSHSDPIQMLRHLMDENSLRAVDLVQLLGTSKSLLSDILNYRRGLSKEMIRKLSAQFKVSQELFNRPYTLKVPLEEPLKTSVEEVPKNTVLHN